jgi:hypothetical protein
MGNGGTNILGSPQEAIGVSGSTLLVWQSTDNNGSMVMGRILNSLGDSVTGDLVLSSENSGPASHPAVAPLDSNKFVVTWSGLDTSGNGPWIWYRLFDANGSPLGPEQTVESCSKAFADYPSVTAIPGGAFAVAWESVAGAGVYFSQFDLYGNPTGVEGDAATGSTGWPVLEGLDGSTGPLILSVGVYGSDSRSGTTMASGNTLQVSTLSSSCP